MVGYTKGLFWKYTTLESFMNHIDDYLDGKLYFSALQDFNDPMEGVIYQAVGFRYADIAKDVDEELKKCKVLCLTTTPENPAMWAHYAESLDKKSRRQPGVCVGIRLAPEFKKKVKPIEYNNEFPLGNATHFSGELNDKYHRQKLSRKLAKSALFHKFEAWKYEDEQRIVIQMDDPGTIKIGEFEEVILGYSGQSEAREKLERFKCWEGKIRPNINAMRLYTTGSKTIFKASNRDPEGAMPYVHQGFEKLNNKDYDGAIADFNKAIKQDSEFALAYLGRGIAYRHQDYYGAIKDYTKAIELDPNDAVAYINRGGAYNEKGDYDRAIADCDKAIELDPNDAVAYNNRGYAYNEKRDYDRAIADYDKAIAIDPNYAKAYINRGGVYNEKGDSDRAIADCDKAIELDPNLAAAYNNRVVRLI